MEGDYGKDWRFTETLTIEYTSYLLGDADLNGVIDVKDVTEMQRHIAEMNLLEGNGLSAADVNGDNKISVDDVTALQRYIAEFSDIPYPIGEAKQNR